MIKTASNHLARTEQLPQYPEISKPFLLIFCGYVIIWYLQIGGRIGVLGAIRFEFIYALILTYIALFLVRNIEISSPLNGYLVAYFIVLLIQVPLSQDFATSWTVFLNRIIKFAFMAFFIVAFVRSPQGLRYFLGAFLLACMKIGQEGYIGKITGSMIWENQGVMRLHGTTSLYAHPNSLSGNALGSLPFIYYLFPLSNLILKGVFLILALFAGIIILYTGSRTGYVGFLVFILMVILKSKNKTKMILVVMLISVIGLAFIPEQYAGRFVSIFTQTEVEGHSSEKRIEIIKDAWPIFFENPFGIGISAFPKVRMEKFGRFQDTHNLYLEVLTNLGIQGFIVFFLFVYKMLKTLKYLEDDLYRQIGSLTPRSENLVIAKHVKDLQIMHATSQGVYVFIVIRLALGLFGMDLYEIYWWFAFGLTIALWNINKISVARTNELLVQD